MTALDGYLTRIIQLQSRSDAQRNSLGNFAFAVIQSDLHTVLAGNKFAAGQRQEKFTAYRLIFTICNTFFIFVYGRNYLNVLEIKWNFGMSKIRMR